MKKLIFAIYYFIVVTIVIYSQNISSGWYIKFKEIGKSKFLSQEMVMNEKMVSKDINGLYTFIKVEYDKLGLLGWRYYFVDDNDTVVNIDNNYLQNDSTVMKILTNTGIYFKNYKISKQEEEIKIRIESWWDNTEKSQEDNNYSRNNPLIIEEYFKPY